MKSSWLNPPLRLLAPFEKPGWVIYCHGTSCGGFSCQAAVGLGTIDMMGLMATRNLGKLTS